MDLIPIFFIPYFIEIPAYVFLGLWFAIQFINATVSQGQAGGVARMDQLDTARRAVLEKAVEKPRFVVFKVTTAPGTGLTSGRIKSSVLYRGAEYGEK